MGARRRSSRRGSRGDRRRRRRRRRAATQELVDPPNRRAAFSASRDVEEQRQLRTVENAGGSAPDAVPVQQLAAVMRPIPRRRIPSPASRTRARNRGSAAATTNFRGPRVPDLPSLRSTHEAAPRTHCARSLSASSCRPCPRDRGGGGARGRRQSVVRLELDHAPGHPSRRAPLGGELRRSAG